MVEQVVNERDGAKEQGRKLPTSKESDSYKKKTINMLSTVVEDSRATAQELLSALKNSSRYSILEDCLCARIREGERERGRQAERERAKFQNSTSLISDPLSLSFSLSLSLQRTIPDGGLHCQADEAASQQLEQCAAAAGPGPQRHSAPH